MTLSNLTVTDQQEGCKVSTVRKCPWCCYFTTFWWSIPFVGATGLLPSRRGSNSQSLCFFHKSRNQFCEVPSPLHLQTIYTNFIVSITPSMYDTGVARQVSAVERSLCFFRDISYNPTSISKRMTQFRYLRTGFSLHHAPRHLVLFSTQLLH